MVVFFCVPSIGASLYATTGNTVTLAAAHFFRHGMHKMSEIPHSVDDTNTQVLLDSVLTCCGQKKVLGR